MVKRHPDWYKLQKDSQSWDAIPQDLLVYDRLKLSNLKINFDYCHYGLRNLLEHLICPDNQKPDFYIITDIELSKKPLGELFTLYKECYDTSTCGIYLAALSYYLEPDKVRPELTGLYSENIDLVFRENFAYASKVENCSTVIDFPQAEAQKENFFKEGVNYIFVHPNIKYFHWKNENIT